MNKRWDFSTSKRDSGEVLFTASPRVKELTEWLHEQSIELSRKIAEAEEELMLNALSTSSLEALMVMIKAELKRRKEFTL